MTSHSHYREQNITEPTLAPTLSSTKSMKSINTYQRYTDWDSSSSRTTQDTRDEQSAYSYERHAAYVDEVRDSNGIICRASPRHKQYLRCENASLTRRVGRVPREGLMSPTSVNAVKSWKNEEDVSVKTSITNSRSVSSVERRRRNARYEPSEKSTANGFSNGEDVPQNLPTVVRTRSKTRPSTDANTASHCGSKSGNSANITANVSHTSNQRSRTRSREGEFTCVQYCSDDSQNHKRPASGSKSRNTSHVSNTSNQRLRSRSREGEINTCVQSSSDESQNHKRPASEIFRSREGEFTHASDKSQTQRRPASATSREENFTPVASNSYESQNQSKSSRSRQLNISSESSDEFCGQGPTHFSLDTYTVSSTKSKSPGGVLKDTTPRMNNTSNCNAFKTKNGSSCTSGRSSKQLLSSSISTFTKDDTTVSLDIPSSLQFTTTNQMEIKYWMDLSVRAAMSVIQSKGSQRLAETAANTVLGAAEKIKLREKKRDMSQVLRFLATKTSVAVLEAGGDERVATAVASTILTYGVTVDVESVGSEDRSVMLGQIDRCISDKVHKSRDVRVGDLTVDGSEREVETVEENKGADMELRTTSTVKSDVKSAPIQRNRSSSSGKLGSVNSRGKKVKPPKRDPPTEVATQTSDTSNDDVKLSHSNVAVPSIQQQQHSPPVFTQQAENISPSMTDKERYIDEATRLNAKREQEVNEKIAALDAATNALLAKANNVQQYIDQQVAQNSCYGGKEYQTIMTGDDPGYHHNFNGQCFQVADHYRHNPSDNGTKEKSMFEKFTSYMMEFTACATPTTGAQASYGNNVPNHRLQHMNCNGDSTESNYNRTYDYSEKNEDVGDMISALTDDMPVHKRRQQNSRLRLVTDHERLEDYNRAQEYDYNYSRSHERDHHVMQPPQQEYMYNRPHEPNHVVQPPQLQIESLIVDNRMDTQPYIEHNPTQSTIMEPYKSPVITVPPSLDIYSPASLEKPTPQPNHPQTPDNAPMHQALDSAMHQLSFKLQEPHSEPPKTPHTPTQKEGKSSGIIKLKGAFFRKKTPKSVSFGDDVHVGAKSPKSPGRKFFGRKKNELSEC